MLRFIRYAMIGAAVLAVCGVLCGGANAGTILKLSLSEAPADITFDGNELRTLSDGDGTTDGDQNTSVLFLDFVDGEEADILAPVASFTMSGLIADGDAIVFNSTLVLQDFLGGSFTLYAPDDSILLSGDLTESTLSGPIGEPVGALFTSTFGTVTGGSLAPLIADNSLRLSMNFTNIISDGNTDGFAVDVTSTDPPFIELGDLVEFDGDASVNIQADPIIPEPSSIALLFVGVCVGAITRRLSGRNRRS